MFGHSSNTAPFFSILMAALIFSLSLAGVAAAQGNTSLGSGALQSNTTGINNTALGLIRSITTPRALSTPPSDAVHSLTTPRATTTAPSSSEPMCLPAI
jgi:hypothetical protein